MEPPWVTATNSTWRGALCPPAVPPNLPPRKVWSKRPLTHLLWPSLLAFHYSSVSSLEHEGEGRSQDLPGPVLCRPKEKHTVINVIKCPCGFCDWLESRTLRTAPLPERTRVPTELQTVGLARVGEGRRSAASEVASVPARSVPLTRRWVAESASQHPRAPRSRGGFNPKLWGLRTRGTGTASQSPRES